MDRITPALAIPQLTRRGVLSATGATLVSLGLAGCGGDPESPASSNTLRFGVNANAAIPTTGYDSVFKAFTKKTGIKVKPNKLLYTEQVNNYLQQAPDDVFIWNAGYRMRFFADQGLVSDLSSVWANVEDNVVDAVKPNSLGSDEKPYFIPFYNYPWVMFYKKSVFEKGGYEAPTTLDELKTLGQQMQSDGLEPIAFADKEGWEAMGTFDILNMRTNGYDFHISLLNGEESWTDDKVKQVFATWTDLLPLHQEKALGRTWQEAAQSLAQGKSGMYFMGTFISAEFPGKAADDLDFFVFPEVDPAHGTDAIDAPIDGFMMVADPDNREDAGKMLEFLASGEAQDLYLATDPNSVGTAKDVDTSKYTPLQAKYAETIAKTANIAQFLDRDTRPDFSAPVVLPAIQKFLRDPSKVDSVLSSVESQAQALFTE